VGLLSDRLLEVATSTPEALRVVLELGR
jgi:hypothetical protein